MAVKNLKSIRLSKGLTQKELAIRSGVNRGTIAYYETVRNINPTHIQLRKISDVLGVTVEDLVAEEGEEKKHFIFDWCDRHPKYANIELFQNVPAYVMERADVQRTIKANPDDNRLELIKLWEYLPSEQYRVTLLSLFYGDEDISKEFSAWEALFPSQIKWEVRFCDAKPPMDETGKKIRPGATPSSTARKKPSKKKAARPRKKTARRKS
jgi:putative transcriptional regulator